MKKFLATLFATIGLVLLFAPNFASAEIITNNYVKPSIKNAYCGPVMHYTKCKCAWHGQYCDQAGMDQSTAAAYVTEAYNAWEAGVRQRAEENCKASGMASYWSGSGCVTCTFPHFNIGATCMHLHDLCSDDPNINYDQASNRCFCKEGYNKVSGNRCEAICPEDDPSITYDPQREACVCAEGYEPATNEEGEEYCKEAPEVTFWATFDSEGPYLADGETTVKIEAEIFDTITGEGVDAEFDIGYTNAGKKGVISDVEEIEDGKYTMTYQVPNLEEQKKSGIFQDYLYVYYHSKKKDERAYKSKKIPIAAGLEVPVMIRKPGYKDVKDTIIFTGPTATLYVSTKTADGEELDVVGAQAALADSYETFEADSEGVITVLAPQDIESEIEFEKDIVLEMTAEAYDDMRDTARNTSKVAEIVDADYGVLVEFTEAFPAELAATPNFKDAEQLLAGMKRTKYALFHILRGEEMLNATTKGIADTIKDQMWDALDYIDLLGTVLDAITGPMTKAFGQYLDKGMDYIAENPKEFLAHIEKVLDNKWVAYFTGLVEADEVEKMAAIHSFLNKASNITNWLFDSVINAYSDAVKMKSVNFKEDWFVTFLGEVRNKVAGMGVKWVWDKVSFENFIQSFFRDKHQETIEILVDIVSAKVARGNWNAINVDTDLLQAKWNLDDLMMWYRLSVGQDVRITEHKAYIEGFLDIVVTPLKFTVILKDVASAIEDFYKLFKIGVLNNDVLFRYIDATGVVINDMTKAVTRALGGGSQAYAPALMPIAFAQEEAGGTEKPEIIESPYDEATETKLEDYSVKTGELDLITQLQELTELAAEAFPDPDGELAAYQQELAEKATTLKSETEVLETELEPVIDELKLGEDEIKTGCANELDVNCDGKVDLKDLTWQEWVALIITLGIVVLIVRWIIRKIRKK